MWFKLCLHQKKKIRSALDSFDYKIIYEKCVNCRQTGFEYIFVDAELEGFSFCLSSDIHCRYTIKLVRKMELCFTTRVARDRRDFLKHWNRPTKLEVHRVLTLHYYGKGAGGEIVSAGQTPFIALRRWERVGVLNI